MSVSLSRERDRIQRQVEELEQSLSLTQAELELHSSETDDGTDGEDEIGWSAGLLAQRDRIQRQIQNLEDVLGPHSPVSVSEDSSSDESELGLSLSADSCLQMNLVYQQVVQETLDKLETLLTHNQRQQRELVSQLSRPIRESPREQPAPSSYQQPISVYLGRFLKPYFKDKLTGLGPPANQEAREKASRTTGCPDDKKLKLKRWESWQKTLLIHSVSRDSLRRLVQPKLSRVDYLSQKLSSAGESERQQLREQTDSLEREIDLLRGKKEEELIGHRYDEHDWQKISNIDFEGTRDAEDLRCFWQNFLHPSINKTRWSREEVQQLKDISRRHGDRCWEDIAQELGTGRTAFMCLQTFQRFVSDSLRRRRWAPAEDALLRELVDKMRIGNFIPYTQMTYFMEGRYPAQLIYRWNQVLDPSLKKGPWTKEEDQLLLRAVSRNGERDWWKIRLAVPGRSHNACRDRYHDCLKAGMKRGAFDEQERDLLLQLVNKYGVGRWAKIAAEIPHRLDCQCMREWRKLTRPPVQKGRRAEKPPRRQGGGERKEEVSRTKKIRRQLITLKKEEEVEEDSTEEEEDEMAVVYMDSDDEEEKKKSEVVEVEEQIEEEEKEYTFPPMTEWIPADRAQSVAFLNFRPVALPSPDADSRQLIRSTVLGKAGCSVFIGPPPKELPWGERHSRSTMMMVTPDQLRAHLKHQAGKFNQQTVHPLWNVHSGKDKGRVTDTEIDYKLQAAVMPWIGNLLIPASKRRTAADVLREQGERTGLSSTPTFLLLLQAMNVDAVGCKEMIERRKSGAVLLTPTPDPPSGRKHNPKTVAGMLQQRRARQQEQQDLELQHRLILTQLKALHVVPPGPPPVPPLTSPPPPVPPSIPAQDHPSLPPQVEVQRTSLSSAPVQYTNTQTLVRLLPKTPPFSVTTPPTVSLDSSSILSQTPTPSCSHLLSTQNLSLPPSPSIPTNQHTALAPSRLPAPFSFGHDYTSSNLSPAPSQPSTSPAECDSAPSSAPKGKPKGRKRGRGQEQQVTSSQDGQYGGRTSTSVVQEGKRVRKPSQKARALQEAKQAETEAKEKRLSSPPQQKRHRRSKQDIAVPQPPVTQLPSLHLTPGQSVPVMTRAKLVQLVKAPHQGLQLALIPSAPLPPPPGGALNRPLAPPPLQLAGRGLLLAKPLPVSVPVNHSGLSQPLPSQVVLSPMLNPGSSPFPSCLPWPPPRLFLPYKGVVQMDLAEAPPPRREALQFDPSLMFLEPPEAVRNWLSGQGGVVVPRVGMALPYLPPFVSSLSTLKALLQAKRSLTKSSLQLLQDSGLRPPLTKPQPVSSTSQPPTDLPDSTSDLRPATGQPAPGGSTDPPQQQEEEQEEEEEEEVELVAAVRQLVADRFSSNLTYQLLKARFLSCFTVPSLLATIQPITEETVASPANEAEDEEGKEEEEEEFKKIKEKGRRRRAERSVLLCDGTGAPANHFSGIVNASSPRLDQTRPDQ